MYLYIYIYIRFGLGILSGRNQTYFAWRAILWCYDCIIVYSCFGGTLKQDRLDVYCLFPLWNHNVCPCCWSVRTWNRARQISNFHRQGFDHHHAAFERQSHVMVRTVILYLATTRSTVLHCGGCCSGRWCVDVSSDSVHVDFRFATSTKEDRKNGGKKYQQRVRPNLQLWTVQRLFNSGGTWWWSSWWRIVDDVSGESRRSIKTSWANSPSSLLADH